MTHLNLTHIVAAAMLAGFAICAQAQMAKWIVKPSYDDMEMPSLTISATPYGVYQIEFEVDKAAFAANDDTNYFKEAANPTS